MKEFAIIGLGNFGCYLARRLYEKKRQVGDILKSAGFVKASRFSRILHLACRDLQNDLNFIRVASIITSR